MKNSARLFNCAKCQTQAIICRDCDRGNIYCSSECSQANRRELQRLAGKRYQASYQGRLYHAERQRKYRARLTKKVTHQGSQAANTPVLFSKEGAVTERCAAVKMEVKENLIDNRKESREDGVFCSFCSQQQSNFLRRGFIRYGQALGP